jgi:hypothetical protein
VLCEAFSYDPATMITKPEPAKPEPPKATFSIRGEDLNPLSPQYPGIVTYLQLMYGISLPPAQLAPPPPLVKAPQGIEPVDKHDTRRTGRLTGPGPM